MADTTERLGADPAAVEAFAGRFATDMAAVAHAATVVIGDKLGLYRALAAAPATPAELAEATGCDERYLAEWLCAQAASGYAVYDPATGRFSLDAAQATCLADEDGPAFLAGGMAVMSSLHKDEEHLTAAYRTGAGVAWGEHHHDLFTGTERFFRPGYAANLTSSWIPALQGMENRLRAGARVADVGCGHGASTILLAQAYPASTFVGFDSHEASVATAARAAEKAGVSDRVRFEMAGADDFPGPDGGYDLVCVFDALHDMGDPVAAARHIRSRLRPDGTWLLVEPAAGDTVEDNLNLVGRIFYSASSLICVPASRAQAGSACLGAQAGPARLARVCADAGFTRFREATSTPFNLILEVRP